MGHYDSVADADTGKEIILPNRTLDVFSSASIAAASREGLEIVEGDLWFFAFDGSPLKARFSKEPYVRETRYFPGVYSLEPGSGEKLQEVFAEFMAQNPSPHIRIIVWLPPDDESARAYYGWPDIKSMKEAVEQALTIFPSDMVKRVAYESKNISLSFRNGNSG